MAKKSSVRDKGNVKGTTGTTLFFFSLLIAGVLVGIGLLGLRERNDPANVLRAAIENNMRTASVTRLVEQGGLDQGVEQKVQVNLSPDHHARGLTTLTQAGTSVRTESVGTPSSDYVRYTGIETDQTAEGGGELDFSNVLDVWGRSANPDMTTGELYGESVLGVVPLGNLPKDSRDRLMEIIREQQVYQADMNNVQRSSQNGRSVYTYNLQVQPQGYIALLRQFGREAGLTQLESLNPENYQNATPLEFTVSVDVWSQRISSITFPNGRIERFVAYGLQERINRPEDTIPIEELQRRIQNVQ